MFSSAPIRQALDTIAVNKQHFLGRMHFFVIIVVVTEEKYEPQILNIVFPIKTGNRYLEYLENTQPQQTGKYNFII
jgi:outer membrane translocation and assembly module TamA